MDNIMIELYIAINKIRKSNGLDTLIRDKVLEIAASTHAGDMAKKGFFGHKGSDKSTFIDRVKRLGTNTIPSGEILAKDENNKYCVDCVIKMWIDSPMHKSILLDPQQKYFGCGHRMKTETNKSNLWVVVFSYHPVIIIRETI